MVQFHNIMSTLGPMIQADRRNALAEKQYAQEQDDRAREREAAIHVPAALAGDKGALSKIAAASPATAFKIAPLLERMDNNQRAKLKEASDWTNQAAMGVLSVPPEQRPAAYAAALAEGRARGFDLSRMPQQYGPAVESQLNFYVGKARDINKWFEETANRPTPMGPAPSGAPASAAPSRDAFVSMMTPHALEVAKATGLDPRLVLAQSALETGFGTAAPGNNYFGIKSHGRAGGQTLATSEAGPNGMVPTQASFRTYADPGASARDYADFLRSNSRYAPVLSAQGLEAQIEAMGRSGYATDPAYASKLRTIAQSLPPIGPQPTMGTPPASIVAQGTNAAPMPEPLPGMAVAGTPAEMPGMPRGLPQGDNVPADGSGTPLPPSDPVQQVRGLQLPPGARIMAIKGVPVVKDGTVMILTREGQTDFIPLPQRKPPGQAAGPFAGNSMDAQSYNIVLQGDPSSPQYAAAYANLSAPKVTVDAAGRPVTITPNMSWARPPTFQNGAQSAPGAPAAPPAGQTTTQLPGGQSVTVVDAPTRATPKEIQDLRTARVEADTMLKALDDYKSEVAKASFGDSLKSMTGMPTALNTSFNVAALLAKGEQLFNLGVLNGPDLDIIRRTLPDPSTFRGGLASKEDINSSIDKVTSLIRSKLAAREKQVGVVEKAATPQGGDRERTLFDARKAIEQGAPRDKVIERLRSMGIDPGAL